MPPKKRAKIATEPTKAESNAEAQGDQEMKAADGADAGACGAESTGNNLVGSSGAGSDAHALASETPSDARTGGEADEAPSMEQPVAADSPKASPNVPAPAPKLPPVPAAKAPGFEPSPAMGAGDAMEVQQFGTTELEEDAADDARRRLAEPIKFHAPDTTLNVLPSSFGGMLMTLNEGGLQYLLAGARASVGMKAGRYMFEVKLIEFLNQMEATGPQTRAPVPRNLLRIGFSTCQGMPLLGDTEQSICFDSEGNFLYNRKRSAASQRFACDCTIAVVLNLFEGSPNCNTISLFKDGVRICEPQALPEALIGKALYPTVTFKNVSVHINFGPDQHCALPFRCRMLQDAALDDVEVSAYREPKDGKYDVVLPVCLPDEGTFEWLDWFLMKNPHYTELSDRKIIEWSLRSGLWRPKSQSYKASNDKPDMNLGVPQIDDGSVKSLLTIAASTQHRNLVVMEVKGNLTVQDRIDAIKQFRMPFFRKVAWVLVGQPEEGFKSHVYAWMLREKQENAVIEFQARKNERARKRALEMRQRQVEIARKRAERIKKKMAEEQKRKEEMEAKAGEAKAGEAKAGEAKAGEADGEEAKAGEADGEEQPATDGAAEGASGADAAEGADETAERKEDAMDDGDDMEDEEMPEEPPEEEDEEKEPPAVELTETEKKEWFRKRAHSSDLSGVVMGTCFSTFTLPGDGEGFDQIKYLWHGQAESERYVKRWILDHKLTTRVEDLQPSDWFREKWQDWQRDLQAWHMKHLDFKDPTKRAAMLAARSSKKEDKPTTNDEDAGAGKPDADPKQVSGAGVERKGNEENKSPQDQNSDSQDNAKEEKPTDESDPIKLLEEELERQDVDVFDIDNLDDVGNGDPLFANFAFEDWALLSLRFELHLLVHAFRRDCSDPDRPGFHSEHLPFYYTKYYKKGLSPKNYGVESVEEMITMVRDCVTICAKVIESQVTDDLETNDVFVKLTEESRRERQRRLDAGDQSAILRFVKDPSMQQMHQQQQLQQQQPAAATGKAAPRPPGLQSGTSGAERGMPVVTAPRPRVITQGKGMYQKGKGEQQQQSQKGDQQWYQPRTVYGMRSPAAAIAQQRALLSQGKGGFEKGWRYNR